jgi:hypothetical protein
MKLSPDERAERALWLCAAMAELKSHDELTREFAKERRLRKGAIAARIEKLRREVETGESEPEQLEIPEGGE